ncbi:galactose-specific lectin nattectin-like [Poeciliopsis prolifica]|nr:galactose-specific lectin nattectin-like [Poeciliopsis prolifica]
MRSTNEYHFIRDLIYRKTGTNTRTWVGGHDSPEDGIWFWSDGSKFLFHQWGQDQPSHTDGIEHCVNINNFGQDFVEDSDCNTKLPFVCSRSP